MDGFSVDSESIRRSAQRMKDATDQLLAHVDQFNAALSSVGDPWGFDSLGLLIGGGYSATESLAITTFDSIVDSLDDYVARLHLMADAYDAADTDAGDRFDALGEEA